MYLLNLSLTQHCARVFAECAHIFYKAGAKLILCARREQELLRVKENLLTIPVVSTCTFNDALERSVLFARIRLKNTLTRKK